MKYKKIEINNYNIHLIKTKKFKTVTIEIMFKNKLNKKEVTKANFLTSMLTYTTKKYNTKHLLSIKEEDLYGLKLFNENYRLGSYYISKIGMVLLEETYSEKDIIKQSIELLKEIIFNPNVIDNKFDIDSFNVVKNDIKSEIERIKEDSKRTSLLNMLEKMDSNSPISTVESGYLEDLENLTNENLYEYYKDFINNSEIDIYVAGNIKDDIVDLFKEYIYFNKKNEIKDNPIVKEKLDVKKQIIMENDNTNQGKLSIGLRLSNLNDFDRNYSLIMYNVILGLGTDSKFFRNIREKHSLCYYCYAQARKLDNIMIILSGINKENFEKVIKLIEKEMNDMKLGKFSKRVMKNAVKFYISSIEETEDSELKLIQTYYASNIYNIEDLKTRKKLIKTVTKKDIVRVAKNVSIDTIYLLGGDKRC